MNTFSCSNCQQRAFFENSACTNCGAQLAYIADENKMVALTRDGESWRELTLSASEARRYRLCANYSRYDVCNWAFDAESSATYCPSCQLTQTIPDLDREGNRLAWFKLEQAKRRLVYSLLALKLPLETKQQRPDQGLSFRFLADSKDEQVLTGHAGGVITINLAEADDVERERRKRELGEPYRTLIGHFRHEVGHYYWERLVQDTPNLGGFRRLFGDEREDYADALQRHYENPVRDWQDSYISAYASSHPWEDWAETWAHYLHMVDSLDTARSSGLRLRVDDTEKPFDQLTQAWFELTYLLNNLNRSLGQDDAYPFVLSDTVLGKLEYVHDLVT